MSKYEEAHGMSDERFIRRFGFSKKTINLMLELLREAYAGKHKRRGRHSKLLS